ncbi:testicular haploid expressed gene protein [Lingula anatina]|uniref:Testicular haploid expressed gene protein n=1 Tax=Lingula anatina TaxID=7574 RepID=A0A1S3KIQ5_LINAN|nr:testicular haploid expressed gene protein-like [Lingula anatina]XP_013422086.1 testicular haploid expressed gene protein [Lingula anatina]|eukprot:XP_013390517.1 testicular haploid expressed gene protein-like [Lingula anatina]
MTTRTSMAVEASIRRVDELARPKPMAAGFVEDRRSVYWIDRWPPGPGPNGTTVCVLTPRQMQLVLHRNVNPGWKGDRPTPIWQVSKGAQKAEASERIEVLAMDRKVNPNYSFDRSPYTVVPEPAKKREPTDRLEQLAQPKPYKNVNTIEYEGFDWTKVIWPSRVSAAAMKANATPRLEVLAEAKNPHPKFVGEKPVQWPVLQDTLKASASARVQQLARPKSRTRIVDDYDPYKVSNGAKKAHATPRVCELSLPIPRKIREKKLV